MPRLADPPPPPARKPRGRPPAPVLPEPRDVRDRPRGWQLALRRQRRRVRPLLYGLLGLGALVAVASLVHASSREANLTSLRQRFGALGELLGLRVQHVVVRGSTATPQPVLMAAIGAETGDALLGYSVADARARILTIASVEDAMVQRRWPGTILVTVSERHPIAVWQNAGRFVLIDRGGAALADQKLTDAGTLPLVVGTGAPGNAAALLDALAGHDAVLGHMVAAVRVSDRRWNLQMTSGATVLLPEDDVPAALKRLDMLQADHQVLDRRLKTIDLRMARRATLRPDPAAMPSPGKDPAAEGTGGEPAHTEGGSAAPDAGRHAPAAPAAAPAPAPASTRLVPLAHSHRQPT